MTAKLSPFQTRRVVIPQLSEAAVAIRGSEIYFPFLDELGEATRPLTEPGEIMAVTARLPGRHLQASRCAYADVAPDGERFTILHDYTDDCASTVGDYHLSLYGPHAVDTLQGGDRPWCFKRIRRHDLTRGVLQAQGYEVLSASNGAGGINHLTPLTAPDPAAA